MNILLTGFGLSRCVIFLFVFVIIHAVGNLHVMWDPGILIFLVADISTPVCTGQGSVCRKTVLGGPVPCVASCAPSSSRHFV